MARCKIQQAYVGLGVVNIFEPVMPTGECICTFLTIIKTSGIFAKKKKKLSSNIATENKSGKLVCCSQWLFIKPSERAQLEKSLLLPFNIITVVLTERRVTVGECWGQIPEGKSVCSGSHALSYMDPLPVAHLAKHFQFIHRRPSMQRATSLPPPSQPMAGCWLLPICRSIKTLLLPVAAAVCVLCRRNATCLVARKLYVLPAH